MKIHYFASEDWEEDYVKDKLSDYEVIFHNGSIAVDTDLHDDTAEVLCTFIESRIDENVLDKFPSLKLIATRSTGFDHIDLNATKARGITVVNVPFYGENTVAEFAFALILSLSRRIPEAEASVKSGAFSPKDFQGFDLSGKTLGVVGCGHIGMHIIKMANGFNMNVIGFDTHRDENVAKINNFTYADLPTLLMQSDIISLNVPYNAHTHHLINKENISTIKKGAYIINTSRGAVIETEALIEGLRSGILAGAGLDVLEEEGNLNDEMVLLKDAHPNEDTLKITLENHYLIEHPRVIVTPHLAFNTKEAVKRIIDTSIDNIKNFANGTPNNVVIVN